MNRVYSGRQRNHMFDASMNLKSSLYRIASFVMAVVEVDGEYNKMQACYPSLTRNNVFGSVEVQGSSYQKFRVPWFCFQLFAMVKVEELIQGKSAN